MARSEFRLNTMPPPLLLKDSGSRWRVVALEILLTPQHRGDGVAQDVDHILVVETVQKLVASGWVHAGDDQHSNWRSHPALPQPCQCEVAA